jgi:amino acid transporter
MKPGFFKRLLVGAPMLRAQARHERLSKTVALAVFSSDALSSVAYATEEILLVLVSAGAGATHAAVPIALAIAGLLVVVAVSYQQTIHAYPGGGGAYIVSRDHLGTGPSLVAAAALLTDYVLTVAVSIAAGVAAVTSAFPELLAHRVPLALGFISAIALANLRGVRESGRIFAVPTYLFIATFALLLGSGFFRAARGELGGGDLAAATATAPLGAFLVLRAFAAGCTALTGIEAISDGVAAFRPPEARNAATTLGWMATILTSLFLGVTWLAWAAGVMPTAEETVVSQLARRFLGGGPLYYLTQAATALILILAANTAFADFPRLAFFLARDRFVPRQLATQGDRLVFSNGILILAGLAGLLVIAFQGDTHALIPLYAVGVFISFTLSQSGMARRWVRTGLRGWRWRLAVNGLGAALTGAVTVIIAATKFIHGAWIVVLLVPVLVLHFRSVHRHYARVARELSLDRLGEDRPFHNTVLVLVGDLHRGVVRALRFAQSLSPAARAVYVETDPERTRRLEERWTKVASGVPLIVLSSPYRSILGPLLDYLDQFLEHPDQVVTIVIPEFIPRRFWHHLLHNQTALLVKAALLFRRNVVVIDVPFHLET